MGEYIFTEVCTADNDKYLKELEELLVLENLGLDCDIVFEVVTIHEEVVGGILTKQDDDTVLFSIVIDPLHRGHGLSTRLIEDLIKACQRSEIHIIEAVVTNRTLMDSLKRKGFKQRGIITNKILSLKDR